MREMKDSGIEWIGEIPQSWKTTKLKYTLSEPMKYGATETGIDYDEKLYRYIRITDIDSYGNLKDEGKLSLNEQQANGYELKNDTILFARSGGTVGKSFLYKSEFGKAAFAGYLISAVANISIILPKWIMYYSNSSAYWEWTNRIFTQATIQNIGADKYNNMPIPLSNISEQKKIIAFLDTMCSEIDALIADIQQQIDTLEQYKRSVITEAVTKGLDRDVEMKSCDIPLIDTIPKEWEIIKTGYLFRENVRTSDDKDTPLSLSQADGLIATDDMKESSLKTASYEGWKRVKKDDLVLNRFKAHLGVLFSATIEGKVSFHYGVFEKKRPLISKYYEYLYHTHYYKAILGAMSNGMTVGLQNLSNQNFYSVKSIYPQVEEQEKIVEYLDKKCSEIDLSILEKQKQIETIGEYKKSLIFEYVTGKKEVAL